MIHSMSARITQSPFTLARAPDRDRGEVIGAPAIFEHLEQFSRRNIRIRHMNRQDDIDARSLDSMPDVMRIATGNGRVVLRQRAGQVSLLQLVASKQLLHGHASCIPQLNSVG